MKGNREGQESWSEDDLFDLDSALAWGGNIEDIADFLGREVSEVERKASERLLIDRHMGPGEKRPTAPSVRREIGADQALRVGGRKS
jgi:hypothetical protein